MMDFEELEKRSAKKMRIWYSSPGEISANGCWVGTHSCYLYTHDKLLGLLWQIITEWKNDRHVVG